MALTTTSITVCCDGTSGAGAAAITLAQVEAALNPAAAAPATTGAMTVPMNGGIVTITPTGACTFNGSGGRAGSRVTFLITTSGASSFVLTWGANFKSVGTLATGVTTAKVFTVTFVCKDGALWCEEGRTIAM